MHSLLSEELRQTSLYDFILTDVVSLKPMLVACLAFYNTPGAFKSLLAKPECLLPPRERKHVAFATLSAPVQGGGGESVKLELVPAEDPDIVPRAAGTSAIGSLREPLLDD